VGQRAFAQGQASRTLYNLVVGEAKRKKERKLEKGQKIKEFAKEHKWLIAAIIVVTILAYIIVVVR